MESTRVCEKMARDRGHHHHNAMSKCELNSYLDGQRIQLNPIAVNLRTTLWTDGGRTTTT